MESPAVPPPKTPEPETQVTRRWREGLGDRRCHPLMLQILSFLLRLWKPEVTCH